MGAYYEACIWTNEQVFKDIIANLEKHLGIQKSNLTK